MPFKLLLHFFFTGDDFLKRLEFSKLFPGNTEYEVTENRSRSIQISCALVIVRAQTPPVTARTFLMNSIGCRLSVSTDSKEGLERIRMHAPMKLETGRAPCPKFGDLGMRGQILPHFHFQG